MVVSEARYAKASLLDRNAIAGHSESATCPSRARLAGTLDRGGGRSQRCGVPTDHPALWRCSECGREFANRNQSHACGRHDLEHHFVGKQADIRAIFDAFVAAVEAIGPVKILPEKTRIAFQVRMSFAQLTPRQNWVDGHLVLARRLEDPRFRRVETFSPRNHLHAFRLSSPAEVDDQFRAWLAEAYLVGDQQHLTRNR